MGKYSSVFELGIVMTAQGQQILTGLNEQMKGTATSSASMAGELRSGYAQAGMAIASVTAAVYTLQRALEVAASTERENNMEVAFAAMGRNVQADLAAIKAGFQDTITTDAARDLIGRLREVASSSQEMGNSSADAFTIMQIGNLDATAAADALTAAINTGRAGLIKKLGVTMDMAGAQRRHAESLGVTVEALSEEAKKASNAAEAHRALADARAKSNPADMATDAQVALAQLADAWDFATEAAADFATALWLGPQRLLAQLQPVLDVTAALMGGFGRLTTTAPPLTRATDQLAESFAALIPPVEGGVKATREWADVWTTAEKAASTAPPTMAELAKAIIEVRDSQALTTAEAAKYLDLLQRGAPAIRAQQKDLEKLGGAAADLAVRYAQAGVAAAQWMALTAGQAALDEKAAKDAQDAAAIQAFDVERQIEMQEELGKRMKAAFDPEKGGAGGGKSKPETISAIEAEVGLRLARAKDEQTKIILDAALKQFDIDRDLEELRIDEARAAFLTEKLEIETDTAVKAAELAKQLENERNAQKIRADLRADEAKDAAAWDAEMLRQEREAEAQSAQSERDRERLHQEHLGRMMAADQAFQTSMGELSASGWETARDFADAMGHMTAARDAWAATEGKTGAAAARAQQAAAASSIAASFGMAAAFTKNKKTQYFLLGLGEVAEAAKSGAEYDFWGAGQHAFAAGLFFYASGQAGKAGASVASGAGGGKGAGSLPTIGAQNQGQAAGNVTINVRGMLFGSEKALGAEVGHAVNAAADVVRFDKRVIQDAALMGW